jgi:hypothetical protein
MMPTFPADVSTEARTHDPSFPLFRPHSAMSLDPEDDLANGLATATTSKSNSIRGGSPEYDTMFMEMTNQETDGNIDPGPGLEQETSHASEALDLIRTASNDSANDNAELEDGENVSKHFDDFLDRNEPT